MRTFVKHSDIIQMTQVLPSGRKVFVTWERDETQNDKWRPVYSTDSVYHICPFTGEFKDCVKCECYNESPDELMQEACWSKLEYLTDKEMASRASACEAAEGCTVRFLGR